MDNIISKIDNVLLFFWNTIVTLFTTLRKLLLLSVKAIQFIWKKRKQTKTSPRLREKVETLCEVIENGLNSQTTTTTMSKLSDATCRFNNLMYRSKKARRLFFIIATCFLFLYIHPYSYWGPWYKYQRGTASYYTDYYKKTASGKIFLPNQMTAAHRTLPFGTSVLVKNNSNNRQIVVVIIDRGPFKKGRIIDLNKCAAHALGFTKKGLAQVTIYTRKNLR